MSANASSESGCRSEVNSTCDQEALSVTTSAVSMTAGILSNSLALLILRQSYCRIRLKSKAYFLLFAGGLVGTDLLGHLIIGSLVLFVHSSLRRWEAFDPHRALCGLFGACMVFFGLSPLFLGSSMAVERCMGVARPLYHSTAVASRHMKRLLGLAWLLAALVAALPLVARRPYRIQHSRSWCFLRVGEPRDWLDVLLPLLFSTLGLLALLLSIVCNALTSCCLLQARLCRKPPDRGTPYHLEMICQLLAIMLVSCVCWGPLLIRMIMLSTRAKDASFSLLLVVRMATWNQILDPWVYILLRRALLRKLVLLLHRCWGPGAHDLNRWTCSVLRGSTRSGSLATKPPDGCCPSTIALPDTADRSVT